MPVPKKSDIKLLVLRTIKLFNHEEIDRLIEGFKDYAQNERQNFQKIIQENQVTDDENNHHLPEFTDIDYSLNQTEALCSELAVIALYKKIEIETIRAIKCTFDSITDNQTKNIETIKKVLQQNGIDLEKLPNYNAMDEIRLLNNCIKHNDSVIDVKLAAYNWPKGAKLEGLEKQYNILAPLCVKYMNELVDELIPKRVALIGNTNPTTS